MEQESPERTKQTALRWLWISMGSLAATLFLVHISFFFFWIFGGLTTYSFFLFVWYLDKATRKVEVFSGKKRITHFVRSNENRRKFTLMEWVIFGILTCALLLIVTFSFQSKVVRQTPMESEDALDLNYNSEDDESIAGLTERGKESFFREIMTRLMHFLTGPWVKIQTMLKRFFQK
ncbi:MAG: hypothetical protein HC811_03695 [Flammeovirgaceae bacterium]|nr:hypothetical protein [Flammeovirgaceae bacterium]